MKKILFLFLTSAVLVNAQNNSDALSLPEGLGDKWLLEVEGDTVKVDEFWTVFNKNNFKQEKPTKAALAEYFDLFQKFKLKVKEAEDLGLDTSEAFRSELAGYQKQLAQSYLKDKSVTEALIKEAYERTKWEVDASHILISTRYHALPSDSMEAYKKALKVKSLADAGLDFDSLAVQYSDDPSVKENQGHLGYFSAFKMVYPFESGAFNTAKGKVSKIVRTRFGYHIIKVLDKRPATGKIKVAHIMLVSNESTPMEEANLKAKKIKEIYELLQKGESFTLLAKKHSEHGNSARKGGELPWFESNQYDADFENAAYSIPENGAYSAPIKTKYGWHIIKRLDKQEIGSFEKLELEMRKKVARSDRAAKSKESVLNRIKERYDFEEKKQRKSLNWFFENGDSTMVKGAWKAPENAKLKKWMFKFAGKKYLQKDFANYLEEKLVARGSGDHRQLVNHLYEKWVEETCFEFEEAMLPIKNEGYRRLLKEYRDGIILFDLTDQKVWTKAIKDSAGLNAFYEANKSKWMWGKRIKGELYTCASAQHAKQVLELLNNGADLVAVLEKVNKDSQLNVRVENVFADTATKDVLRNFEFVIGISPITNVSESFLILKVNEVLEAAPKDLLEVKGLVAADYQELLMEEWLQALSKKYRLTFNKESLKELMKNAE